MIFYVSASLTSDGPSETPSGEAPLLAQSITQEVSLPLMDDPDSPLHGLSLNEIQDISVMPVSGWLDPQMNERFLRVVDEGVFDRPSGLPARRVRHYLWMKLFGVIPHPIPAFFRPLPGKKSSSSSWIHIKYYEEVCPPRMDPVQLLRVFPTGY